MLQRLIELVLSSSLYLANDAIYASFTDHYSHRAYGRLLNDGLLDEVHHCLRDASIRDAGKRLGFYNVDYESI